MDCPTCGKSLATERGMRQHHAKVHDEPLPNRTCSGCGAEFYDPKARREYCDDCNPNAGEHNGNWRDAAESAACDRCGREFAYYPSDKKGVYCSTCVESAEGALPSDESSSDGRLDASCEHCGESLRVYPSRLEGDGHGVFCDRSCHGSWLAENVVGPDHHQLEGGDIEYGDGWWQVRRQARERDDHTCRNCGTTRADLERNLDVHHIDPVRSFTDPADAHTLDNVVTLCRPCHRRIEAGTTEPPWEEE